MPISEHVDIFFKVVNVTGLLAFSLSGAVAAIKKDADIFGVLMLALVASTFGGIFRDILLGDLPPAVMRSHLPIIISVVAGLLTYFFYSLVGRLNYPIEFFDALGLGVFAVLGANKAMIYGISPIWSIGMGMLTAVGGGAMRDIMLTQVPFIFKTEIYATAAFLGALIMVLGKLWLPGEEKLVMLVGATACSSLRLIALHYRWNMYSVK